MPTAPILVVGAGPTGLLLALWLKRLGVSVRVIDKDEGPGETSRAMVVQARTLEFYRQLGFGDDVVAKGLKVERVSIREGGGKLEGAFTFGDIGGDISPYPFALSFPQDEHERALLAQLEQTGLTVERRTALMSFTPDDEGVNAELQTPSGPETLRISYLAGCDGARSTVREGLGIALPGGTYAQRFFVADAKVTGDAAGDSINVCLTGSDFCLVIPLKRETGAVRLIGVVPDEAGEHARFEDVLPSVIRNTGLTINAVNWFSTYHVHHRVSDHFQKGRAFLLGDAAHLHSPVGGQGMNTGLGDAANLGWKLAAVSRGATPALLDTYEPERIAFARRLVATTDRMFQLITDKGLLGKGWRTLVMAHALPLIFKLPVAPRLAFAMISQTEISYRDRALAEGSAGKLRGGDRLPWVAAVDNFAPLRSLAWQAHVYGNPAPGLDAAVAAHEIALHRFAWSDTMEHQGLTRDALYLVRPDGHIGFVTTDRDTQALTAYAKRWIAAA